MIWPYQCLGLFEPLLDRLPRLLARPISYVIVFGYFRWKLLLVGAVIACSSGSVGLMCLDDLPSGESIPALLILTMLSLFALWQWNEASHLRERLHSLEEDLGEEELEYEYPNGDIVEN
jgi:hypothetical protein